MRIKGSGSGFSGFNGGSKDRSDSFRHGRRPGQKVRGILIKWVTKDRAWVRIDGHDLLAQLNSAPPVGTQLTFIIKQLNPDIMLKEIFEVSTAGSNALGMASSFENARTLFENSIRPHCAELETTPQNERLSAFVRQLAKSNNLFATFQDAATCVLSINSNIDTTKSGQLYYQPWLVPAGRRHITLVRRRNDLIESILECELGHFGMIRAEFLHKDSDTGYRLKIQNMGKAAELKKYLNSRKHPWISSDIECLGISKLPQSGHGGIMAELMFTQ